MTETPEERINIARDGWSFGNRYQLTDAQIQRKRRGKSIYNRDRQVEEYKVSKGEWV